MDLFPKTRAAKVRMAILVLVFVLSPLFIRLDRVLWFQLSEKQEGDILFQSLPHSELADAIEGITHSELSHCGILLKRDGKWLVAEASAPCRYTELNEWIMHGRGFRVASYRLKGGLPGGVGALKAQIALFIGKGYDITFEEDDRAIYCSELIDKAYARAYSVHLAEWEALGELDWKPHEDFIRKLERTRLPLDRRMITPVQLSRSSMLEKVY